LIHDNEPSPAGVNARTQPMVPLHAIAPLARESTVAEDQAQTANEGDDKQAIADPE